MEEEEPCHLFSGPCELRNCGVVAIAGRFKGVGCEQPSLA